MLTGRQKVFGGLLVGVTAMLVGYAVTQTFAGSGDANAMSITAGLDGELDGETTPDISLSSLPSDAATGGDRGNQAARGVGLLEITQATTQVTDRPRSRVYTVQNNDSFWKIAQKVYGDAKYVNKLCSANAGHKTLRTGMRVICPPFDGAQFQLQLPCVDEAGAGSVNVDSDALASIGPEARLLSAAPAPDSGPEAMTGRTHAVASGENLYDIAKKYYNNGSAWPKIASANPKINPNAIRPGQTLIIP